MIDNIRTMYNVLFALFLREYYTRFTSERLSYFWFLVEPITQIMIFVIIKSFFVHNLLINYDLTIFIIIGMITFLFIKNSITKSMGSIKANQGLLFYQQVKPIDTIITRVLFEFFIFFILIILFLTFGFILGKQIIPDDLFGFLVDLLIIFFFSFSISIFVSSLNIFFKYTEKIVKLLFMPLVFLSGIFFTIDVIPFEYKELLLYNPLLHIIESVQTHWFNSINSDDIDYIYILSISTISLFSGLFLYSYADRRFDI